MKIKFFILFWVLFTAYNVALAQNPTFEITYRITDGNEGLIKDAEITVYDCNTNQLIKTLKSDAQGKTVFALDISVNSGFICCIQKNDFIAKQIAYNIDAPSAKNIVGWKRSQLVDVPLDAGQLSIDEVKPFKRYIYKEAAEPGKGEIELDANYNPAKWNMDKCSGVEIKALYKVSNNSNPKTLKIRATAENKKGELVYKAKFKLYKKTQLLEEKLCDEEGVVEFEIADCRNSEYLLYAEKKGLYCDKAILISTLSITNTDEIPETGAFYKDAKIGMIENMNPPQDIVPVKRFVYNGKKLLFEPDANYKPVKYNFSVDVPAVASVENVNKSIAKINTKVIGGILTIDSKPLSLLNVGLYNKQNKLLQQQKTNQFGHFIFSIPDTLKSYKIKNVESLANNKGAVVNLSNDKGQVLFKASVDNMGYFEFKVLPSDEVYLPLMTAEDEEVVFEGKLFKDKLLSQPLVNQSVKIEIEGQTVSSVKTDSKGEFKLKYPLQINKKTELVVEKTTSALAQIYLANKNNKLIKELKSTKAGDFRFEVIPADEVKMAMMEIPEDHLNIKIKGKLSFDSVMVKPIKNAQVYLADNKGTVIKQSNTNNDGYFEFNDVKNNINYTVGVKSIPETKSLNKIYLFSENNKKISKMNKGANGEFTYSILPSAEIQLKEIIYEDPWLDLKTSNKKITESILFEFGSSAITPEAKTILYKVSDIIKKDKSLQLIINAHTDSRGDAAQNLKLSEQRAQSVMNYLVENGVEGTRLKSLGHGETKLLNKCKDGVECSASEHAINRRIEFEVTKTK